MLPPDDARPLPGRLRLAGRGHRPGPRPRCLRRSAGTTRRARSPPDRRASLDRVLAELAEATQGRPRRAGPHAARATPAATVLAGVGRRGSPTRTSAPPDDRPLGPVVAASDRQGPGRRSSRDGRAITADSPAERLHDLRKDAKKLRYLLECFGEPVPGQAPQGVRRPAQGSAGQPRRAPGRRGAPGPAPGAGPRPPRRGHRRHRHPPRHGPAHRPPRPPPRRRAAPSSSTASPPTTPRPTAARSTRCSARRRPGEGRRHLQHQGRRGEDEHRRQPRLRGGARRRPGAGVGPRPAGRGHLRLPRASRRCGAAAAGSSAPDGELAPPHPRLRPVAGPRRPRRLLAAPPRPPPRGHQAAHRAAGPRCSSRCRTTTTSPSSTARRASRSPARACSAPPTRCSCRSCRPRWPAARSSQLVDFLDDQVEAPDVLPLLSMVDRRRKLHRELVEQLGAEWPELLDTVIPSAAVDRAHGPRAGARRRVRSLDARPPAPTGRCGPRSPPASGPRNLPPMHSPALLDADVEHFVAEGWLLTRSHDDVDAVVAWVDEVAAWPDDGPWLHHRELTDVGPAALPHRELRAVPRGAAHPAHHAGRCWRPRPRCSASRPCSTRRRSTTSSRAAPATRRTRTRRPTASSRRTCRAWSRSTTRWWATAASRSCPAGTRRCCRWTTPAASAPTWPPSSSGRRWRCGRARRSGSTPARRTAAVPTSGPTPRRALYPTYNALAEGDLRAAYYEQKRAELGDGSAVSLIGDFQGRPVT